MNVFSFKKVLFLIGIVILLVLVFGRPSFTCQSRADSNEKSFRVCLKRLLGRDNPPLEPLLRPEYTVRLIEGWTLEEMADYFTRENIWDRESFLAAVDSSHKDLIENFSFLADKPTEADLQGYLFPDTYRIFTDSEPEDLLIRMLENFDRKLSPQMRQDIINQGKSIHEIITMASLIEKEAPIDYRQGDNSDAKIISGIFWQRIRNGQALQSCATLAFILGINKERYSEADTKINSPYNTYQHRGLPPGPIANPGILAIEAAIYPTNTNYNYFLTPTGTKEIIYAQTYNEHLSNRNKYLQ